MNSPFQAERLFSRCFTHEQLSHLRGHPEFVDATSKIDSLKAAIEVVELGDKILRKAWSERPPSPGQKAVRLDPDSSTGI